MFLVYRGWANPLWRQNWLWGTRLPVRIVHQVTVVFISHTHLDHHTPVLANAYEPEEENKVRQDRLQARNLEPESWLGELKRYSLEENEDTLITLLDGSEV